MSYVSKVPRQARHVLPPESLLGLWVHDLHIPLVRFFSSPTASTYDHISLVLRGSMCNRMSTRAHALFFDLIPLFLVDVVRYEIHKRDSRIEDLCFVTNSIKLVGRDMAGRPVVNLSVVVHLSQLRIPHGKIRAE